MATLAKSAVADYPAAPNLSAAQFYADRHELVVRRMKLTLTGEGGLTNTITGTALGFDLMVDASSLWDAQNSKGYPTAIDPVNNLLILLDGAAAPAPVDVTSTDGYVTVIGRLRVSASLT